MRKRAAKVITTVLFTFIIFLNVLLVQAINLEVSSKPVSNTYVIELDKPAVFDLTIRNLGEDNSFSVYSLVGIDMAPKESFIINSGETKIIRVELTPQKSLRVSRETPFTFEYKIKDSKNNIQDETLSMNILDLKSVFLILAETINPKSEAVLLTVKNRVISDFPSINIKFSSIFFEHDRAFSLGPNEKKEIVVPIDNEKLKVIDAGTYLMNSKVTIEGKSADVKSEIKFSEEEGVDISEIKKGFIIQISEITVKNTGNTKKTISIDAEKDLISYLFITTNIPATSTETKGFKTIYIWERELIPNEELKIEIKTNWLYPLIILIILIAGIILIRRSIYPDLELRKKVSFVKTKGGEFALKVTVKLVSKNYVEKINLVDRLPPIVELYKKFGLIPPKKIDLNNRRLEWNIESLNKGESRIFTYIIYSKIGVVGKFELPEAKAVYEKDGQIKEVYSNRAFYVNEPKIY